MSEPEVRRVERVQPADLGIGQLFELVGDAVIVGDAATGRIVLWNPSAERLFGYSADEAVGLPIEVLVPPPLKGRHRDGLARFAGSGETNLVGTGRSVEVPALRKDGGERWVELTLSPAEAVGIPGRFVLALVRDVTERRNAHAQVAAYADQLAAANRSLREFLVMAAHDLRTPLSSILAAAEVITKLGGRPAGEVLDLTELIVRQVNHLSALIADLAEMGAIEAGEVRTSPTRLLVADAVAEAQELAGLELPASSVVLPGDLSVWADPVHARRIISNYLANARNYADTGISLEARPAGDSVEICVADRGPGVPEEFVPRLFDKFSRGASRGDKPGHGLGLAIVAGLARLNGGTAWYEPNRPSGARFWVRLPAHPL